MGCAAAGGLLHFFSRVFLVEAFTSDVVGHLTGTGEQAEDQPPAAARSRRAGAPRPAGTTFGMHHRFLFLPSSGQFLLVALQAQGPTSQLASST